MKNPLARLSGIFNRAASYASMKIHVAIANLWRDGYNPLRGLTISRAVAMLEAGERGAYAELQWTYRFIEMQDATIGALVERRTAAIQQLDWAVKIRDKVPAGKEAIAKKQQAALEAAYDRIENLSAAFETLAMAAFRGFTHLEMVQGPGGEIVRLEPVDQWFWVRDGLYGKWQLNPDSRFGVVTGKDVPLDRFIVREAARPINRVALIAFIRKNLSQKDWDAFIETYGVPAVFIVMPDNVPTGKEEEYLEAADAVASDARGVLPGGSKVETVNSGVAGEVPFMPHLKYQDEQIVMRGTGGLLTMLSQSGSGTLAGSAHADTFAAIARADAREISEILQTQFDRRVLDQVTPGEPVYAYFELAANEETDSKSITEDVARLNSAGYKVKADWIAEKTGYELEQVSVTKDAASLLNRGGWRTLEDGRKVFIEELSHPTEDDDTEAGKSGNGRDSKPKSAFVKFKQEADDRAEGEFKTGQRTERFRAHPSQRGVRDKVILKSSYVDTGDSGGFFSKGRGDSLAEGLGARYSRAQNGYVLTKPQFAKWKELIEKGYDSNSFSGEIYHPDPENAPPLTFKLRIHNREAADEKPAWLAAMADDLQPLGQALEGAMNAGDEAAMNAALKKISARMPDFLSTTGLEDALEKAFTSALSEP